MSDDLVEQLRAMPRGLDDAMPEAVGHLRAMLPYMAGQGAGDERSKSWAFIQQHEGKK